jgi:tyrosine-protein kinase Etk/Wzc
MTPTGQIEAYQPAPVSKPPELAVSSDQEPPVSLLDTALLLASQKEFILKTALVFTIITVILVFVIPVDYTSTAAIMPPQKQNSASALLGELGGLAALSGGGLGGSAAGMLGLKNPGDLYIGLLQSETIEDAIVHQFDLMHVYKKKRLSDARKKLKSNTRILSEKSSLISIAVEDHSPTRAAAIANAYISHLHDLMSHLAISEAAQRRVFFEHEVDEEKKRLADAEEALVRTEQKTGIIQPQGQTQAVIMTIMQLQAQISATEVELSALRASATNDNPKVITLESQLAGLRARLSEFEKGHPQAQAIAGDVLPTVTSVPTASLEYLRSYREVQYHQTLFDLLARQYELAKVDEAQEAPLIQVVDPALVPDKRSWPPRTILTLLAFFLGALLASFWVLVQAAYRSHMQDPEFAAQARQLRHLLAWRSGSSAR